MDPSRKDKVSKVIRMVTSGGWASGDLEIAADWHDRAVRLVHLVAANQGSDKEARELAKDMLDDLDAVDGGG
ncbi:MAG: hypothetical protein ABR564_08135 [Candidatus Dormibacteria bacterium]